MKKQILTTFLLIALLASASCGAGSSVSTDTTTSDENITSATAEDTAVSDKLGSFDFGGDEFHMLTRDMGLFYPYLDIEAETGNILDDTIYRRNRQLEERFNFLFEETIYTYAVEKNDYPRQFLLSGDTTFDLYTGRFLNLFNYASEGLIVPVGDIPHIDPNQPYWDKKLYSDLEIANKHFFAIGDFNLSSADFTHVMLFNKAMAEDYNIGNLYDIVRSGSWTFDTFAKLSKLAVQDLNGDSVINEMDQFGYTSPGKQVMPGFWIGANTELVSKDEDGMLTYIAPNNEKLFDVFQRIYEMTWDDNVWHANTNQPGSTSADMELGIFMNGSALFTNASCFQLTTLLREFEVEFGIIPYPKWDENQKEYYSRIENCELFGISYSNENREMAGVILEAMACASYNSLKPAYFDTTLRVKGTRDEDSAEMLDIIFANRVFDYADTLLCSQLRDGVIYQAFQSNNRNMVSVLTGVISQCEDKINTYNNGFIENAK